MNILITGANGQLGNEMRIVAQTSSDTYIFTDVNQVEGVTTTYLDITDLDAVRRIVTEHRVGVIVNCAAWTNVDACETDESLAALAEKLNAEAPHNLAVVMKEVGGLLIHISTDYVFGQEPYNVPCREEQQGTPTGVYGATKKHGEDNILASGCDHVILRTAWLYSEFGKNFCKTMLQLTATKPQLKVVFDQCGTPTYALDLAQAIVAVIEDYKKETLNSHLSTFNYSNSGIYHYSNEGVCSWYDFTKMIQQVAVELNVQGSAQIAQCDVQPCHSDEFPSPVKRPSYSVLDKTKIKEVFGVTVPYWTDSLRKCIFNLKK
jgi:dTDP-4-dehydrorhamnose reductase